MTTDPLDTLASGDSRVAPRPAFTADLRERLLSELDVSQPDRTGTVDDPRSTGTTDTTPSGRNTTLSSQNSPSTTVTTSLSPYLIVDDGRAALSFYERALNAVVTMTIDQPDGRLGHAELTIDGASFSIADEFPEYDFVGPRALGNSPVTLDLVVPDVDAVVDRAVAAGATLLRPVAEQFYGSRSGQILDPFGHRWTISTPGDQVSVEEMQRRNDKLYPTAPESDS